MHLNTHFNCWLCTWLLISHELFLVSLLYKYTHIWLLHMGNVTGRIIFYRFYSSHFCIYVHADVMCIEFNVINR